MFIEYASFLPLLILEDIKSVHMHTQNNMKYICTQSLLGLLCFTCYLFTIPFSCCIACIYDLFIFSNSKSLLNQTKKIILPQGINIFKC